MTFYRLSALYFPSKTHIINYAKWTLQILCKSSAKNYWLNDDEGGTFQKQQDHQMWLSEGGVTGMLGGVVTNQCPNALRDIRNKSCTELSARQLWVSLQKR